MNARRLIAEGLRFYWRTHLGVVLGAAVATAVLVGALVVGDSVRYSLRSLAVRRLGGTHLAMSAQDRFVTARAVASGGKPSDLAGAIAAKLGAPVAPVLLLDGSAVTPDETARANRVQVVGVDERFWQIGGLATNPLAPQTEGQAVINEPLAEQLGIRRGETGRRIIVRVPVPSGLPREAPLSTDRDAAAAVNVAVKAIISDEQFGRFSLRANQLAPFTVFLPLSELGPKVTLAGRANVLLVGGRPGDAAPAPDEAQAALDAHWKLADADLQLRELPGKMLQLATGRVFLDPPVGQAALAADSHALGVLTYFANEIRHGERASPYPIVAAMAPTPQPRPDMPTQPAAPGPASPVPAGLEPNGIVLNQWLADDIQAKPGDTVSMKYFVLGPMRTFTEETRTFRVHSIVPVGAPGADPNLLPDFPGLAGEKNCREWKPGVKIDFDLIRPKDEKYWTDHRGTPKAFLRLDTGQRMWGNERFGNLTAVRYPPAPDGEERIAAAILKRLSPAEIGLYFLPVRQQALAAANPTSDFGGLFLGLSFFLIAAAVLLTALLFVFGVQQRSAQTGTLLALGFGRWRVRGLLLAEGLGLAVLGALIGGASGLEYTRVVLYGLATVWQGVSEASAQIRFHAAPSTVAMGAGIGVIVAMAAMFLALVLQGRASARELLAAGTQGRPSRPAGRGRIIAAWIVAVACAGGAVALAATTGAGKGKEAAEAFFNAGGLLLVAALSLGYALLAALGRSSHAAAVSLTALGLRTCGRRRWRSLTTAGLLACGVFLVAAVEVFRAFPSQGAAKPSSGTGGFALYGESALPVLVDLNDAERRKRLALDEPNLAGMKVTQLRLQEGDDASCLNLNRAQRPRLLGVKPAELSGRFTFVHTLGQGGQEPWDLLNQPLGDGALPAVGDEPTVTWALGKKIGDSLDYTDERGRAFKIRLVGVINSSILQGSLLISDAHFRQRFLSVSGYRVLLTDAPADQAPAARKALSGALADFGLEVTPAVLRLSRFSEVENTYLSIFAALGGLGLLLGSVALGVVVGRNVMERRGELALLRAVGFSRGQLQWMVLCEHWALLVGGLLAGVVAAVIAVLPALRTPGAAVPYASWLATLAGVLLSGVLWTWLAAAIALRGDLLPALRTE